MPVESVTLAAVIDAISEAKASLLIAIASPPRSAQRAAELGRLYQLATAARLLADAYRGRLAMDAKVALRVAELGYERLRRGRKRS